MRPVGERKQGAHVHTHDSLCAMRPGGEHVRSGDRAHTPGILCAMCPGGEQAMALGIIASLPLAVH